MRDSMNDYSMTRSTRTRKDGGMSTPSSRAVFRLTMSSTIRQLHRQVGGASPGQVAVGQTGDLSPLQILVRTIGREAADLDQKLDGYMVGSLFEVATSRLRPPC